MLPEWKGTEQSQWRRITLWFSEEKPQWVCKPYGSLGCYYYLPPSKTAILIWEEMTSFAHATQFCHKHTTLLPTWKSLLSFKSNLLCNAWQLTALWEGKSQKPHWIQSQCQIWQCNNHTHEVSEQIFCFTERGLLTLLYNFHMFCISALWRARKPITSKDCPWFAWW